MDLNPNVWYVRLFFWSLGIWSAFLDDDYRYSKEYVEKKGTNLCFFTRVIVIYMPSVLFLHLAFVVIAVASLTYVPIHFFGFVTYVWILATIAVVIGGFWLTHKVLNHRRVERIKRQRAMDEAYSNGELPVKQSKKFPESNEQEDLGFFEVVLAYIIASKKKICPTISFSINREVEE